MWDMWILWEAIIPGCGLTAREKTDSLDRQQVQFLAVFYWDKNHSSLEITAKDTDLWNVSRFSVFLECTTVWKYLSVLHPQKVRLSTTTAPQ